MKQSVEIPDDAIPEELRAYLDAVPDVTEAELKELAEANQALDADPAFLADLQKSLVIEQLLEAMEEAGMNKNSLATKWGRSRQYLSKLLNEDQRINFTIETMCELAHVLKRRVSIHLTRPTEQTYVMRTVSGDRGRIGLEFPLGDEPNKVSRVNFRSSTSAAVKPPRGHKPAKVDEFHIAA
jgi:transcriptional regulator with XRE-family HTH domain